MNIYKFTELASKELQNSPAGALIKIPSGNGIFHIASISPPNYISGFISTAEGRWKQEGEYKKHFANNIRTCNLEVFGVDGPPVSGHVCEHWKATGPFLALNINAFSKELTAAFFEDSGNRPGKWAKANLFMKLFAESKLSSGVSAVIAPSASGLLTDNPGYIFVGDPTALPIELIETGTYYKFFNNGY